MSQRVENEPAFILHRRPYRETSLLLDVFTLNQGRVGLMARGATRPRNPWKAQLQPFQPLVVAWQGRSDLKSLTDAELKPAAPLSGQDRLYCGFYLNELVQRLVPENEPVPELFGAYLEALTELQAEHDIEQALRAFEQQLVAALGYGFAWDWATDCNCGVLRDQSYAFDPQQGITRAPGPGTLVQSIPGSALLALAEGNSADPGARRVAKRVMRSLLDFLLEGRPLQSRRLFKGGGGPARKDDPA